MKKYFLNRGLIILLILVSLSCNKDSHEAPKEIQKCWNVIDNATLLPIENAEISVSYRWSDSNLGPFLKIAISDSHGKACTVIIDGFAVINASVWALGYVARNFDASFFPDVIELDKIDE